MCCVCVRACIRVCIRACVHMCVRACVCVCVRAVCVGTWYLLGKQMPCGVGVVVELWVPLSLSMRPGQSSLALLQEDLSTQGSSA